MLMESYSQRSLFKWHYAIFIILIISALIMILSFQINRWLPGYTLSFSDLIAQQFQTKISFRTVHYRFPNYIIFKDVNVLREDDPSSLLQASRIVMGFSFPLFSSATPLHSIVVDNMTINFPSLKDYWAHHGKKISAWAMKLPHGNMHLLVPNGHFYLVDRSKGEAIPFNIDLRRHNDILNVDGSWGTKDRFHYKLNGSVRDSGFDLDKLSLEDGRSCMNLWGHWHHHDIDWKGFIFYNKFYVLDINGHLQIENQDIILKKLSFSVNGDTIEASGHCSKQNLFQCDADIVSQNTTLHLHAQNSLQGPTFNGAADLGNVHLDFKDLKARMVNGNFIKLTIKQIQSIFSIQDKKYRVPLEDILASFNFAKPYQKIIHFSATIFGGHDHSRIFLDTTSIPWQIKGQTTFNGININQLSNPLFSIGESRGMLTGTINLRSSKDIELTGNLAINDGDFNNSNAQAWLAQQLQMPSLDHLSNVDLSCHFKIDQRSKILEDLKMDSEELNLGGFFHLDADDLVSSRISIRFSKGLLKESSVGRHVMDLVHRAWTLPFEFRLSGDVHRMNFQWENSPLKDKVRRHIFSYFARLIDRRIDAHPVYKVTIPNESVSPG